MAKNVKKSLYKPQQVLLRIFMVFTIFIKDKKGKIHLAKKYFKYQET